MVKIGAPENVSAYYYTDDNGIIMKLHQSGFHPEWKDDGCIYFRKSKKLLKLLDKLGIDCGD